jgi:hypothetical protein
MISRTPKEEFFKLELKKKPDGGILNRICFRKR